MITEAPVLVEVITDAVGTALAEQMTTSRTIGEEDTNAPVLVDVIKDDPGLVDVITDIVETTIVDGITGTVVECHTNALRWWT